MSVNYTTVELFSGPGGLALGFHFEGFKTLVAYEYEKDCIATYKNNFPHTEVIQKDLSSFSEKDIEKLKGIIGTNSVSIVMGGPPCRSFSVSNPKKKHGDHRDFLYKQLIRVATALNAKYFLMENVEDIVNKSIDKGQDKKIFHRLLEDLQKSGYKYINFKVLNSDDYGVPQSRERLFILATNDPFMPLTFPSPITFESFSKVTVNDAFQDLPKVSADLDIYKPGNQNMIIKDKRLHYCGKYSEQPDNEYTKFCRGLENSYGYIPFSWLKNNPEELTLFITPHHKARIIERYNMLCSDEGQGALMKRLKTELSSSEFEELVNDEVLPKRIFKQKNRRLIGNAPSRTVTSHAREELVHPYFNRNLTAREVARLQSFPDWYSFSGTNQKAFKSQSGSDVGDGRDYYQQIGDAVPPLLAAALAKELKRNINCTEAARFNELRYNLVKYIWKNNIKAWNFSNDIENRFKLELSDILSATKDLPKELVQYINKVIKENKILK